MALKTLMGVALCKRGLAILPMEMLSLVQLPLCFLLVLIPLAMLPLTLLPLLLLPLATLPLTIIRLALILSILKIPVRHPPSYLYPYLICHDGYSLPLSTVADFCQVEPETSVSPTVLTAALDAIGFSSSCIATSTTEEAPLEEAGVNAVWAIATALGGCLAWRECDARETVVLRVTFETRNDGASVEDVGAVATKAVANKLWRVVVFVSFLAMLFFSCGQAAEKPSRQFVGFSSAAGGGSYFNPCRTTLPFWVQIT